MRARSLLLLAGLIAALPADRGAAVPTAEVLRYTVKHAIYGDIGTYSNVVERSGDTTTVRTEAHFKVSMLGIVLHREDADRQERWRDGRLISFHSVTVTNGRKLEVSGEAEGDRFVIASPRGAVAAPADIHPGNPWSANFIGSDTMMRVDTGAVEPVHVSGGGETLVAVGGAKLPAREYEISGRTHYQVWLSEPQQVPVKFTVDDDSGVVTFTLAR
jgi:hypothetical protein